MVSFQVLLAAVAALASVTSASHGRHHMHRRILNRAVPYGYGYNDTIIAPAGTGTGVPLVTGAPDFNVEPTTYVTEATKYIAVTYTLGDGRAITRTITKTVEYETTAYESHIAPTDVPSVAPEFVIPESVVPESVVPESGKPIRTSIMTKYITIPYGEVTTTVYADYGEPSAPAIAPEEAHGTLTVTDHTTSTAVVVVTSTIAPVVPSWSGASASTFSTIRFTPPYGNFTVSRIVENDRTTTSTLYTTVTSTDTPVVGPTGTGGLSNYM